MSWQRFIISLQLYSYSEASSRLSIPVTITRKWCILILVKRYRPHEYYLLHMIKNFSGIERKTNKTTMGLPKKFKKCLHSLI